MGSSSSIPAGAPWWWKRTWPPALQSGKVYAAGLDVVSSEPIAPDNPLLQAPNCFLTPHIAWAPRESRQRLMDIAVENCAAFLRGDPQNLVRP